MSYVRNLNEVLSKYLKWCDLGQFLSKEKSMCSSSLDIHVFWGMREGINI
jgi:hypothetical protein